MIVILKNNVEQTQVQQLVKDFEAQNFAVHFSQGANTTILGLDRKSVV